MHINDEPSLSDSCASCGFRHQGCYCPVCGEKVLDAKQRSLGYLLGDLLEGITSLDNRFLNSLKAFLFQPGSLVTKFREGQRVRYMKPVTFFLMINVIYVALTPLSDFNVNFYDQLKSQPYSAYVEPLMRNIVESSGLGMEEYARLYNQVAAISSRSLIIISAPLLALFIALFYYRRNMMFVDHLVFSLNIYAWIMLWIVLAQVPAYLVDWFGSLLVQPGEEIGSYFYFFVAGMLIYWYLASKMTYQLTTGVTLLKLPLLILAVYFSHLIYRFCQLWITMILI